MKKIFLLRKKVMAYFVAFICIKIICNLETLVYVQGKGKGHRLAGRNHKTG